MRSIMATAGNGGDPARSTFRHTPGTTVTWTPGSCRRSPISIDPLANTLEATLVSGSYSAARYPPSRRPLGLPGRAGTPR